jgi:hypothetical protein
MKRILFITLSLLAVALTAGAQAQSKVSYSGTHYRSNGKLYSKDWVSVDGGNLRARNESVDEQTGSTRIFIYRQDSAKFYVLNPENKKAMVLPMSQIKGGINSLVGLDVEKSRTKKLELLGTDIIEGYECKHYLSTSTSTLKNGAEDTGCFEYWLYEPLGVQMQHKEDCGFTPVITLKNFQQGAQPDALFEIPKGYSVMELPAGGLLEMMTGKTEGDIKPAYDKANQDAKSEVDKVNAISNDPNKTQEQKMQDMSKMLEGVLGGQKKKK